MRRVRQLETLSDMAFRGAPMRCIRISRVALVVLTSAVAALPASAQGALSLGIATPQEGAAEWRQTGPSVALSADWPVSHRFALRVQAEGSMLLGRSHENAPEGEWSDLASVGTSLDLVVRGIGQYSPYAMAGIGGYWLQIIGQRTNPYGSVVPALNGGFGFQATLGQWKPFAEQTRQEALENIR